MAKQATFKQNVNIIDYVAAAALNVGDVVPLTNGCGVALNTVAIGASVGLAVEGVYDISSDTGTAWAVGDLIYWDNTNKVGTKTATSNTPMGYAVAAKAAATVAGTIKLQFKL